jgi:aerotaxis receptor
MARPTVVPRNHERPFGPHELFFSITDRKGVIRSGNEVFVRISGHPHERLIGTAHNIIRHPDMPRAVFKLLWDTIDKGQPFAGYVKNMAADGGYYWVMALIVPIADGYLSVRFKPTTPYFKVARDLYAKMLATEQAAGTDGDAWRHGMRAAGEQLMAALRDAGFASYEHFMHVVLSAELVSHRQAMLGAAGDPAARAASEAVSGHPHLDRVMAACRTVDRDLDELFSRVGGFLESIVTLESKAGFLLDLSAKLQLVSLNALISACRLERGGEGLSVVTEDLARLSRESTVAIDAVTRQLVQLTSSLRETAFRISAAKLQLEMTMFFLRELMTGHAAESGLTLEAQTEADIATLLASIVSSATELEAALPRAKEPIPRLVRAQDELASELRRLSSVHVIGKIQATGVEGEAHFRELLDAILEQLEAAKDELHEMATGIASLKKQLPGFERTAASARRSTVAFAA